MQTLPALLPCSHSTYLVRPRDRRAAGVPKATPGAYFLGGGSLMLVSRDGKRVAPRGDTWRCPCCDVEYDRQGRVFDRSDWILMQSGE